MMGDDYRAEKLVNLTRVRNELYILQERKDVI